MSAVSTVGGQVSINLQSNFTPSGVVTSYAIPANILSTLTWVNGNGAAANVDLAAWGSVSLAATTLVIDFSALADPGGTTRDWSSGRVRLLAVWVTDTTSGHDVKVYKDATNGIAWLPASTGPVYARANGGVLLFYDPNSNGASTGNFLSSTSKRFDFDSGANTVAFDWVALGSSVA